MGFLGLGKKKKVIDLTERYGKVQEKPSEMQQSQEEFEAPLGSGFNLFGKQNSFSQEDNLNVDDKKKKLAKRLADMTTKIEELSNQIYRLQQRIELIERKVGVGSS